MIFHKILYILDPTGHYFWSGAYLYGPRVPNIIGKPRILEIELFWVPGILEIFEIDQFRDPGNLEILEINQHGVLGSWKYWISTNMVYWVPRGDGGDGDGGGGVPTTLQPGPGPLPKAGRKKYPVRGIPHFDLLPLTAIGLKMVWAP